MSRVFVIADLHLGHHLVAKLRGFDNVFAHDNAIIDNWNRVVTKRDVVYVLGDVFRLDRLPEMRGIKKLAMGNHDKFPAARYAEHFTKVAACFEFDGCILTHIPVHPNQFGRYRLNVHGHMHSHRIDDPRYVCVSAEQVGMTPTLLAPLTAVVGSAAIELGHEQHDESPKGPACGHSACSQHFIDTGSTECVEGEDGA